MYAQIIAETPQWVLDGRDYLAFLLSGIAVLTVAWKNVVKPYLDHIEKDRNEAIEDAIAPLREQVAKLTEEVVKRDGP